MVKYKVGDLVVWQRDNADAALVRKGDMGVVISPGPLDPTGHVRVQPHLWRPASMLFPKSLEIPKSWHVNPKYLRHATPLEVLLYG